MSRPVVLTEAQLRAAVAVAEARAEYDRYTALASRFKRIIDDTSRGAVDRGIAYVEHEKEIERAAAASTKIARASEAYCAIRPDTPFEVRSCETLARIVAEKTDGGTECRARDGLLSEVLREFEWREVRDGAR